MIKRWSSPNGYRDVLRVCLPLVVSMGSVTITQFTDRLFLSRYSTQAIAAATPAGILQFTFLCFFLGVASYVNVFVAQYTGSCNARRVGASLWQGIYFCMASALVLVLLSMFGGVIFQWSGHAPEILPLEQTYFRILMLGSVLVLLEATLACFYTGRGLTRTVMWVNILGASVNIPLDYAFIYGVRVCDYQVIPEMGITGAAIATVISWSVLLGLYLKLVFTRANNQKFHVWSGRRFDKELFTRLMRFGIPGGVEFFLDLFAITFFIFMVGRLGTFELAATNIVLAINTLAFLPIVGASIGVSTLVGQAQGRGRPDLAVEATKNTLHLTLAYTFVFFLAFLLIPELMMSIFRPDNMSAEEYAQTISVGATLLKFVCVYTLFDAMFQVYGGALKGAGDTRFLMTTSVLCAFGVLIIPTYVSVTYFNAGLYVPWTFTSAYLMSMAVLLGWRFRQGKWKSLRVIEHK